MEKGNVYLIVDWGSNPEKYKIGITKKDVNKRIKELQTGSSNELVLLRTYQSVNYKRIENIIHRNFKQYSTDGGKEWFQLPEEKVINFIKECEKIDKNITILTEKNNPFF
jgi:hypothetical protein